MHQGKNPRRVSFSLIHEPIIFVGNHLACADDLTLRALVGNSLRDAAAALNSSSMRKAAGGFSAAMYSHISKRSYSASGVQMTFIRGRAPWHGVQRMQLLPLHWTGHDRGSGNSHLVLNEFLMRFGLLLLTNVIAHYLGGRQVGSLCRSHETVTQFRLQLQVEYSFFSHDSYF